MENLFETLIVLVVYSVSIVCAVGYALYRLTR